MKKITVFLAEGFEEVEALTAVDLLRRAGAQVTAMAAGNCLTVCGAHGITVTADSILDEAEACTSDAVVLPGGSPGTANLKKNDKIKKIVTDIYNDGRIVAAICAAPTALAKWGLLNGKRACCYPGLEDGLTGAMVSYDAVNRDGNIITSKAPGTAMEFSLKIIEVLFDKETALKIKDEVVYKN